MRKIIIYTDGACSGNPGIGGWAAVHESNGKKKAVRGSAKSATNNSMELMAAIKGIEAVKQPREIVIYTDSKYLVTGWNHNAEWFKRENRPNRELWLQLISAVEKGKHKVTFVKIAGHAGDRLNELADKLAKEQVVKLRHEMFG